MKMTYTTKDGRITVEFEGKSDKDLFRQLNRFQEVFEEVAAAKVNGKVETSDEIKYVVRKGKYTDEKGKEKEAEYFEKRVVSGPLAGYKKAFGVLDDGTDGLFPKRDCPEGCVEGYNGWHKYVKKD